MTIILLLIAAYGLSSIVFYQVVMGGVLSDPTPWNRVKGVLCVPFALPTAYLLAALDKRKLGFGTLPSDYTFADANQSVVDGFKFIVLGRAPGE